MYNSWAHRRTTMQQPNAASGRQDRELQELIDGQNWKQALALCEKRIKNGERGDKLLVGFNAVHLTPKSDGLKYSTP